MADTRLPTAERRQQISAAALRILAADGARRLTAAALAKEVGIADGTLFRHFDSMQAIVDAAIERFAELVEGTFPPDPGEPLDRLGAFVVRRLALVREHPEILRLAFNDRLAEAAGERGAQRVQGLIERSVTFVGRCLADARDRDQLSVVAPLTLLVWMVIGVLRGAAHEGVIRLADEPPLSSLSPDEIWNSLREALTRPAGRSGDDVRGR